MPGVRRVTPLSAERLKIDATADVRGSIAKTVVESGAELRALSIARASLEDVYTRHFQEVRHAALGIAMDRRRCRVSA
jgi:ABC-2 type transport system ATP-binding protein